MKLLLISDAESSALWDFYQPSRVEGIDAIVSCGDLKREYLEFLVTLSGKPLFYVPGNHDGSYMNNPPGGCDSLDGQVVTFRGLRMAGLGGCLCYNGGAYQYTESEMRRRVHRLRRAIRKAGGLDVLVTHTAVAGCGDAADPAHMGFECFRELLDEFHPAYLLHGHVHRNYGRDLPRVAHYGDTAVVNAFERYVLEIPEKTN